MSTHGDDDHGAEVEWGKRTASAFLGVGYRKAAFPADEQGGKRRTVLDVESTIGRVSDLADELAYMRHDLEATIGAALTAGASWAHIGEALGMTRQGAQRKFADARRTYGYASEEEKARLDKAAGVGAKRITFEVRDYIGDMVSRHWTAANAYAAAAKCEPGTVNVWKVYPQGRAVRLGA